MAFLDATMEEEKLRASSGGRKLSRTSDGLLLWRPNHFGSRNGGSEKVRDKRCGRNNLIEDQKTLKSEGKRLPWPQWWKKTVFGPATERLTHIGSRGSLSFGCSIRLGAVTAEKKPNISHRINIG